MFRGLLKLKFDLPPPITGLTAACLPACLPARISESTKFAFALENFPFQGRVYASTLAEAIDGRAYARLHTIDQNFRINYVFRGIQ